MSFDITRWLKLVKTGRGFMFGHVSSGHILPGNGFRRVQRRTTEGGVFSYFKTLHTFLVETLLSVMPLYSDTKTHSCITKLTAVVVAQLRTSAEAIIWPRSCAKRDTTAACKVFTRACGSLSWSTLGTLTNITSGHAEL